MPFLSFVVNTYKHISRTQPQNVCEQTEHCEEIFTTKHARSITNQSNQCGPQMQSRGRESHLCFLIKNYLEESQASKEAKRF